MSASEPSAPRPPAHPSAEPPLSEGQRPAAGGGAPAEWVPYGGLRSLAGLAVLIALALAVRVMYGVGCLGSDDLGAWHQAWAITEGQWRADVVHNAVASTRYGLILPVALFLEVLGTGEARVLVYPVLMSLITLIAVWDIVWRLTRHALAVRLGAVLVALAPLDIYCATVLLPDGPMAAWSVVALWCVVRAFEPHLTPRATRTWLAACGLIAAWVIFHKEAGAQLAVALGVWAVTLWPRRELRGAFLALGGGLLVGCSLELVFFWILHGDPLHRWDVVQAAQERVREFRAEATPEAMNPAVRAWPWLRRLTEDEPTTLGLTLASMAGAAFLARTAWRDARLRFVVVAVAVFAGMRAVELTQTFSYQPRRLLPLVHLAAVAIPVVLVHARATRGLRAAVGLTVLAAIAISLFTSEGPRLQRERHRLSAERWLAAWTARHAEEVRARTLFTDPRTLKVLWTLRGFPDLGALGIRPPPGDRVSDPQVLGSGGVPAEFPAHALLFENPRVLVWLLPRLADDPSFMRLVTLQDGWRLREVVPHATSAALNAALLVRQQSADPARPGMLPVSAAHAVEAENADTGAGGEAMPTTASGWSVRTEQRTALVGLGDGWVRLGRVGLESGTDAAASSDGTALQMTIDGPLDRALLPGDLRCVAGTHLLVRVPLRAASAQDLRVRAILSGRTARGTRVRLGSAAVPVWLATQELRVYAIAPEDLVALQLVVQIEAASSVEVGPVRVERVARPGSAP